MIHALFRRTNLFLAATASMIAIIMMGVSTFMPLSVAFAQETTIEPSQATTLAPEEEKTIVEEETARDDALIDDGAQRSMKSSEHSSDSTSHSYRPHDPKPPHEPHPPHDVAGSITVCKVTLDVDGNIVPGVAGSTFSIYGDFGDSVFTTPLDLNSDIFSDIPGNEAQCITHDELALQTYSYSIEEVWAPSDDEWEDPLYEDEFLPGTTFAEQDPASFGEGTGGADGSIMLRLFNHDNPDITTDRTLLVINQMKAPAPTDLCPNIDGVQSEVPAGKHIDESGDCVTDTTPPVDLCPNIDGLQAEVPDGKHVDTSGNCVGDEVPLMCDPSVNLIKNGSFEIPEVVDASGWDIFDLGSAGLEWVPSWLTSEPSFEGYDRPQTPSLEIHRSSIWDAKDGEQFLELDGDWNGHGEGPSDNDGEPAQYKIEQTVPTLPGYNYKVSFSFSPRPNTPEEDNAVSVSWGAFTNTVSNGPGLTNSNWKEVEYTRPATASSTVLSFADAGVDGNSLGSFIDAVSVTCVGPTRGEGAGDDNLLPIADAGADQTITLPTATALLDGSSSSDPDGTINSYAWAFLSGPSVVDPNDVISPTVEGLIEGTYEFELTVTDDDGATDTDTIQVTVLLGGIGGGDNNPACSDETDNDSDELVDAADPGCHTDGNPDNESTYDPADGNEADEDGGTGGGDGSGPDDTDGGGSSGGRSGSSAGGRVATSAPQGEILGATSCSEYLTGYIKLGAANDKANVIKLQQFLNEYMHAGLVVDGIYGRKSYEAAKLFQLKEYKEVLAPWVGITLPHDHYATGWVFKTTKRRINMLKCPGADIPMPPLNLNP